MPVHPLAPVEIPGVRPEGGLGDFMLNLLRNRDEQRSRALNLIFQQGQQAHLERQDAMTGARDAEKRRTDLMGESLKQQAAIRAEIPSIMAALNNPATEPFARFRLANLTYQDENGEMQRFTEHENVGPAPEPPAPLAAPDTVVWGGQPQHGLEGGGLMVPRGLGLQTQAQARPETSLGYGVPRPEIPPENIIPAGPPPSLAPPSGVVPQREQAGATAATSEFPPEGPPPFDDQGRPMPHPMAQQASSPPPFDEKNANAAALDAILHPPPPPTPTMRQQELARPEPLLQPGGLGLPGEAQPSPEQIAAHQQAQAEYEKRVAAGPQRSYTIGGPGGDITFGAGAVRAAKEQSDQADAKDFAAQWGNVAALGPRGPDAAQYLPLLQHEVATGLPKAKASEALNKFILTGDAAGIKVALQGRDLASKEGIAWDNSWSNPTATAARVAVARAGGLARPRPPEQADVGLANAAKLDAAFEKLATHAGVTKAIQQLQEYTRVLSLFKGGGIAQILGRMAEIKASVPRPTNLEFQAAGMGALSVHQHMLAALTQAADGRMSDEYRGQHLAIAKKDIERLRDYFAKTVRKAFAISFASPAYAKPEYQAQLNDKLEGILALAGIEEPSLDSVFPRAPDAQPPRSSGRQPRGKGPLSSGVPVLDEAAQRKAAEKLVESIRLRQAGIK